MARIACFSKPAPIPQSSAFYKKSVSPFSIRVFGPSVTVRSGIKREFPGLFEIPSQSGVQLLLEPVHATALDRIFQTGVAPVRTIPEIPLNLDDLLGHPYRLIRETKPMSSATLGKVVVLPCVIPRPPPTSTLYPTIRPFSTIPTKPSRWRRRQASLRGGRATAILNLRGR